jgi:hypothetical protein
MAVIRKTNPFSVILIATSVVLFWRGAWGLMDLYIFPDNLPLSYASSLALGILILIITRKLFDELL